MIACTVKYAAKQQQYDVTIESVNNAMMIKSVYYFDCAEQAIGCLLTNPDVGPLNVNARRALLKALVIECDSEVTTSFAADSVAFSLRSVSHSGGGRRIQSA